MVDGRTTGREGEDARVDDDRTRHAGPLELGSYNRRLVLDAIRRSPGIALVRLAEAVDMTRQGVMGLLTPLIEAGIVTEKDRNPAPRGRPPRRFELNPHAGRAIGLTIDYDVVAGASVDLAGNILAEHEARVRDDSPEAALDAMAAVFGRLDGDGPALQGVGLAAMGPLDIRRGLISAPTIRPDWHDVPVCRLLSQRIGHPIYLDNNATAAGIGEAWSGRARDYQNFVYVFVGFGVGGAIFSDGRLVRGNTLNAGEIGHVPVVPGGRPCGCGSHGCLEAYASLWAIETYRPELKGDPGVARSGPWLDEAAQAFAVALAGTVNLVDPEAIVIGGRLTEPVLDALKERIEARMRPMLMRGHAPVPFVSGTAGIRASAIGAANLPLYDALMPLPEGSGLMQHPSAAALAETSRPGDRTSGGRAFASASHP